MYELLPASTGSAGDDFNISPAGPQFCHVTSTVILRVLDAPVAAVTIDERLPQRDITSPSAWAEKGGDQWPLGLTPFSCRPFVFFSPRELFLHVLEIQTHTCRALPYASGRLDPRAREHDGWGHKKLP